MLKNFLNFEVYLFLTISHSNYIHPVKKIVWIVWMIVWMIVNIKNNFSSQQITRDLNVTNIQKL